MNEHFDIELQENKFMNDGQVQLPMNFLIFGEIESDDVKVYIKQSVYKALEKYATSDTSKELGTIMIGNYSAELGKTHVIISDYIEAKYTDASASTLTFTHETWDYVYKQHDTLYPDKKIVGWQHTHPNYGIFLSNYDLFIQENFFNLPFQIAYVIDPIQNLRGFFQWKNGKIEKLKGYYIYDDVGNPIKVEQSKPGILSEKRVFASGKFFYLLLSLMCVLCLLSVIMFFYMNGKIKAQNEKQAELKQTIVTQNNDIKNLQDQLAKNNTENESFSIEDLLEQIENQNEIIYRLQTILDSELVNVVNKSYVVFFAYTVQLGDTLVKICEKNNIDYANNIKLITQLNGISDINKILVGQTILLPIQIR